MTTFRSVPRSTPARRQALAGTVLVGALLLSGCTASSGDDGQRDLGLDFETETISSLSKGLTGGDYTAVELASAYLARIDEVNTTGPSLRAVQSVTSTWRAQAEAADERREAGESKGPLDGIPVIVKDNIDIEGEVTSAGSLALADNVAQSNAAVVDRLEEAGAVIIAKATLVEFAFWNGGDSWGYSSLGGQPLNPYDASYSTSGSSAGSGIAAAAGLAAITFGSDTGGSVITPSTHMSLVGYRPSTGLVSRTGIVPITEFADTAGVLGKTVRDVAIGGTAIIGADDSDPATEVVAETSELDLSSSLDDAALDGARIGVPEGLQLDDDEAAQWSTTLATLQAAGATVVPVAWQDTDFPFDTTTYEFRETLDAYLQDRTADDFPIKDVAQLADFYRDNPEDTQKYGAGTIFGAEAVDIEADKAASDAQLAEAQAAMTANTEGLIAEHDLDAFLFPESSTVFLQAPIVGYPEIAMPAGYLASDRHPFGVVFLGKRTGDAELFGYAYALEQAGEPRQTPSEVNPTMWRCLGGASSDEDTSAEYCLP